MNTSELIAAIDTEITRLQQARKVLAGSTKPSKESGRKPMSRQARARISAAQKKRWAKARKAK
jgi:hypothetical protein